MSIGVMAAIWNTSGKDLKGSARLLMLAIADNANDDGYAYPGIDHLSQKTGIGNRQVMRLIQKCEADGWITVERRANRVNRYHIQFDRLEKSSGDILSPSLSGDILSPGDILSRDIDVTREVTSMSPEPSLNQINNNDSSGDKMSPESGNAFALAVAAYENNIGSISHIVSQEIEAAVDEFSSQWVIDAVGIAAKNNVRKWSYVNGILKRWREGGRSVDNSNGVTRTDDGGMYV